MRRALQAWVIPVVLGAVGCAEPMGPPRQNAAMDGRPETAMHFLRWPADRGPARFAVVSTRPRGFAAADAEPWLLEQYELRFWAVQGRAATFRIDYVGGNETHPFLQLVVPQDALFRRPDGSAILPGDSVLISLTVDSTLVGVHFEPSGLVFSPTSPLVLDIYYAGAEQDLDGDGDVDAADQALREQRLGIWYQQLPGLPWLAVPATHDVAGAQFSVSLFHFSGYAVSW